MRFLTLALILPIPAQAETAVSIDKFRSLVEGRAFYHAFEGGPHYGSQAYGAGDRLVWWDEETECYYGTFFQGTGDQICTTSEADDFPFCWTFYAILTGFRATGQDGVRYEMTEVKPALPSASPGGPGS